MAQLTTPAGIGKETPSGTTELTVTVTWTKPDPDYPDGTTFSYQFVNKGNPNDIIVPTVAQTGAPTIVVDKHQVVFTFGTNADAVKLKDYIAEVKAIPATGSGPDNSEWGKEIYWIIGPTLTIKIGNQEYTLTKNTFAGATSKIYQLPASADNPITITYDDIKTFATSLGLNPPENYPDGTPIDGSLNIYQLIVDLGNNLFTLSISLDIPASNPLNNIIPHLSVSKMGLVLKRTNGSL
ncbi:hypothetical protein ACHRVW_09070 [Flavobacterium collinsii]|jgi:hypothetical protein|uniref:Uncharacterized protein n=1 Tax=Flavobacterium collinsii TaxID=1114861 RepID=A0A9W4X4D7_9FLAO|nr:hypothetical protein [Flavobacterium collinsii]GIQ60546.1 hypothetical protein Flavo103_36820 [Flavobacterium collinsii]CAI2768340.1 conserved protein of unknown function [Flavobacterium collinsii]